MRIKRKSVPGQRWQPRAAEVADGRLVWIYGRHSVMAAVANEKRRCRRLLATTATAASLQAAVHGRDIRRPPVEVLDRRGFDAFLPEGAVHQGFAMLAEPLAQPLLRGLLNTVPAGAPASLVVLDQATDPRNIGAVLRSALAFRATGVVVQERHAPEETGALAKAACGALDHIPLVRVTNIARGLEIMKKHGFWCTGLDPRAPATLASTSFSQRLALVIGSEDRGLRRLVHEACDDLVRIPINMDAESLNMSAAAAIALYEMIGRRAV